MSKVYIVLKSGVEWNDVIEVHSNPHKAKQRADELNKKRNPKDVFDRLSEYIVETHQVKD